MREVDFLNNYEPLIPERLFKKVVRITWEIDYEYLYEFLKNLNYKETMKARDEIFRYAVESNSIVDTTDAKQKYWERLVHHITINFGYQRPVSGAADAVRKRRKTGKLKSRSVISQSSFRFE